jgi:hypothetical protein
MREPTSFARYPEGARASIDSAWMSVAISPPSAA